MWLVLTLSTVYICAGLRKAEPTAPTWLTLGLVTALVLLCYTWVYYY